MAIKRPSLSRALLQAELNKFYDKPIAKVSFGLLLTIFTVIFFAMVAIKPTLETMAQLLKEIDEKKEVDRKLSQKITALSQAQAELAAKEQAAKILDVSVPPTPQYAQLLKQIEKLASEDEVDFIAELSPRVPRERQSDSTSTTIESIPLTLTFISPYEKVSVLLKDLANLQRILVLDSVEFVPSSDTSKNDLVLTVSLRAFAFGAKPTISVKK